MANYDAGHYFLTTMAPIPRDGFLETNGTRRSLIDHTRHMLTTLPTAQQDKASQSSGLQSPFASVPGTHFAHVFIIDDARYNGRRPSSPIWNLINNVKMTEPQDIDHLPDAYLVLAIDFDAEDGSEATLRRYVDSLWQNMSEEVRLIFAHAGNFHQVQDANDFYEFVREGQIRTNLPFNDYWAYEPPLPSPVPWMLVASVAVLLGAMALALSGIWGTSLWGLTGLTFLTLIAVNIGIIARFGLSPFPKAPDSDLNTILKALYIQQSYTGFAIENLGKTDQELVAAFDEFCETHDPCHIASPSQPPGVLKTTWSAP